MAIAYRQSGLATNAAAAATVTLNVTAGDLLVAVVTCVGTSLTLTCTDNSGSNVWNAIGSPLFVAGTLRTIQMFYAPNCKSGSTIISGNSNGVSTNCLMVSEYSGAAASNTLDQIAAGASGTSQAPSSGATPSTTNVNELLVSGMFNNTGETITPTSGISAVRQTNTVNALGDGIVAAIGAQTAIFHMSGSAQWVGVGATFFSYAVATPTFSPVAGSYTGTQMVTVSSTDSGLPGFAIYYTTDGSTPTTASTLYTGPISVSSSKTIKALAVDTSDGNSAVASAGYTIKAASGSGGHPPAGYDTDISTTTEFTSNPAGETNSIRTSIMGTNRGSRFIG